MTQSGIDIYNYSIICFKVIKTTILFSHSKSHIQVITYNLANTGYFNINYLKKTLKEVNMIVITEAQHMQLHKKYYLVL